MPQTKEEGFYWTRMKGSRAWGVSQWTGSEWLKLAEQRTWTDDEFVQVHDVGLPIELPNARRADAIQQIETLYGAPGCSHTTDVGEHLMLRVLERHGLEALSTPAVLELAEEHRNEDNRISARYRA